MNHRPEFDDSRPLSAGLQTLVNSPELQDVPEGHRLLAALTWRTFSEYQRLGRQRAILRYATSFCLWVLSGALLVGASATGGSFVGMNPAVAATAVAVFTILVASLFRIQVGSKYITVNQGKTVDRFIPGRLEGIFHPRAMRILVRLFGLLFGLELAVIHFGLAGMGLPERTGLGDQVLLAVDNFCYGALLDIFELYGISLTDPVEHTVFSGSVFLLFRTSFDVLLVFLIFVLLQRRGMQVMLDRFPGDEPVSVKALVKWLDRMLIDKEAWIRRFPDEIVFLMLVMNCLAGQDDTVRSIVAEWRGLLVTPMTLRRLVDSQNVPLLPDTDDLTVRA